jgi:hypothetical protein
MGRLVEERIKRPLAEALLFGELHEGGHTQVDAVGDGLSLRFTATPLAPEAKAEPKAEPEAEPEPEPEPEPV